MAKLTCPHCQTVLSDDEHALGFEAVEGDPDLDQKVAELFRGFVITLWKCPSCAVLVVEVEFEGKHLFIGQLYNLAFKLEPSGGQKEAEGEHDSS